MNFYVKHDQNRCVRSVYLIFILSFTVVFLCGFVCKYTENLEIFTILLTKWKK